MNLPQSECPIYFYDNVVATNENKGYSVAKNKNVIKYQYNDIYKSIIKSTILCTLK